MKKRLICVLFAIFISIGVLQAQGEVEATEETEKTEEVKETEKTEEVKETEETKKIEEIKKIEELGEDLFSLENIKVKKFAFIGNQIFSDLELSKVTSPDENREITTEDLQEIRKKLTQYYIDRGYINSGAIFPQQKIKKGVIKIQLIEGHLSKVEISGNQSLQRDYFVDRLQGDKEKVLNINELQTRLLLLKQNPRVQTVQAELSPGAKRGESILNVQVEEAEFSEVKVKFNNHSAPSVGEEHIELEGSHLNFMGRGDQVDYLFSRTQGLLNYGVTYQFPLTRQDTTLSWNNERAESIVVTEPFDELGIRSYSEKTSLALHHPFYRTPTDEFGMEFKLEKRNSQTWLLGRGFSFSPGVEEGRSDLSLVRFSQDWVSRSVRQVFSIQSRFTHGLNEWGATNHEDEEIPDGLFTVWLGQLQWIYHLKSWNSQFKFRFHAQYTDRPLLTMEKFSLGGASTVRGYQESQKTQDQGIFSSIEWKIPLYDSLQLLPFSDYGKGWNHQAIRENQEEISSIGLGLQWLIPNVGSFKIFAARVLQKIETDGESSNSLQYRGIHAELVIQTNN